MYAGLYGDHCRASPCLLLTVLLAVRIGCMALAWNFGQTSCTQLKPSIGLSLGVFCLFGLWTVCCVLALQLVTALYT